MLTPKEAGFIKNTAGFGTNATLQGSIARGLDGNGQAFIPGILIVQSSALDPYGITFGVTQEGKGWTNVVFVHSPQAEQDPAVFKKQLNKLFTHEMGHTLYLQHAPGNGQRAGGAVQLLHEVGQMDCIMTYSPKANREHCGMCQALLRGMKIYGSPLSSNTLHAQQPPRPIAIEGDDSGELALNEEEEEQSDVDISDEK
jgi:hypothetical protein